jgi:hypothetical protein
MKTVTTERYETIDGKVFDTAAEANAHEAVLNVAQQLHDFTTACSKDGKEPLTEKSITRLKNVVNKWEQWKALNVNVVAIKKDDTIAK